MIVFFDSSLILVFLFFALALAYQGYLALRGVFAVVGVIFFVLIAIAAAIFIAEKVRQSVVRKSGRSVWNLFLTLIATSLCLYQGFLTLTSIGIPGDGPFDMIFFLMGLFFSGMLCLGTTLAWAGAVSDDEFSYKCFFQEILWFGAFYFLVFFLPSII